jgi:spermidine synthase
MSSPELLRDLDRDTGWTLMVDGAEQSYVDVEDATHLEFEYMQHIALVIDAFFDDEGPLSALHLGGGACTLPRWLAATRPRSRQTVIEASEQILEAVKPLGGIPGVNVVLGDAVVALEDDADAGRDLVIWDLYDGPRLVTSTLTLQTVQEMRRVLRADGLAVFNLSDATPFDMVRPVVAAVNVVFDDALLVAEPTILRGRRSGNCVLVAANRSLPVPTVRRRAAAAATRGRVLAGEQLEAFQAGAVPPTGDRPLPEPDEASGRGFL